MPGRYFSTVSFDGSRKWEIVDFLLCKISEKKDITQFMHPVHNIVSGRKCISIK